MAASLNQLSQEMAGVVADVRRSLVQVTIGVGQGAGTLWHADGLIVTNAHVIGGVAAGRPRPMSGQITQGEVMVTLPDGSQRAARVLAHDPDRDLAALHIDARDLATIPMGDSHRVKAGQWVFAIGHPWGVRGAASAGVVIGSGAEWPEMPEGSREWVITSLRVRPGNSGGPLVDVRGRLIGINTLMTGPQAGAAVPVQTIRDFLTEALGSRVVQSASPAYL